MKMKRLTQRERVVIDLCYKNITTFEEMSKKLGTSHRGISLILSWLRSKGFEIEVTKGRKRWDYIIKFKA